MKKCECQTIDGQAGVSFLLSPTSITISIPIPISWLFCFLFNSVWFGLAWLTVLDTGLCEIKIYFSHNLQNSMNNMRIQLNSI